MVEKAAIQQQSRGDGGGLTTSENARVVYRRESTVFLLAFAAGFGVGLVLCVAWAHGGGSGNAIQAHVRTYQDVKIAWRSDFPRAPTRVGVVVVCVFVCVCCLVERTYDGPYR